MDTKECSGKSKAGKPTYESSPEEELECAVCLQPCIHPVRLPCSHIFCFLCVKGVANQSKRCAMCRQEIPADFLDNPNLLKKIEEKESDPEGYQWFYEGRNGWWQYDERTSRDLEGAYNRGERVFEVLVAGFLYSVDFDRMVQQRRNDPSRRRRIKRDLSTIPKKGVAGLKTEGFADSHSPSEEIGEVAIPDPSISPDFSAPLPEEETDSSLPARGSHPNSPEEAAPHHQPSSSTSMPGSERRLSPELESLHLLHSDLHRTVYRNHHRRPPAAVRGADPVSITTRGRSVSSYPRLHPLLSNDNSRPRSAPVDEVICDLESDTPPEDRDPPVPSEEEELTDSVDSITNQIRSLIMENEGSEFYSLDGTEEYNLPHDNEDL